MNTTNVIFMLTLTLNVQYCTSEFVPQTVTSMEECVELGNNAVEKYDAIVKYTCTQVGRK